MTLLGPVTFSVSHIMSNSALRPENRAKIVPRNITSKIHAAMKVGSRDIPYNEKPMKPKQNAVPSHT